MVIIQLAGGLGNQMFQYALYLQLKSLGREVKVDDVSGFVEDRQRVYALAPFGATYERADKKELRRMLDSSPFLHARIRRKLCGRKKKSYFEEDKRYRPQILDWDDIYLEGYWQTEKYFRPAAGQVREMFDTDKLVDYITKQTSGGRALQEWLSEIAATESVSVHMRRGDYLLPANRQLFGDICTEEYYRAAMERMREMHPGCVFYLFTNDKEWARDWAADRQAASAAGKGMIKWQERENTGSRETGLPAGNVRTGPIEIVDLGAFPEQGMDLDYAEFALMSKCRHNILANSSFSWWASYLNQNPHKTVLAPDRWLNGWDCQDIYREDMQRIGGHA